MKPDREDINCRNAEEYYYDYLGGSEEHIEIPAEMLSHLRKCRRCQENVRDLEKELSRAGEATAASHHGYDPAVWAVLKRHLSYLGRYVSCRAARPFLPGMLNAGFDISIPTPIIIHLEHCRRCQDELGSIRQLGLSSDQLVRLSEFLAGELNAGCVISPEIVTRMDLDKSASDGGAGTVYGGFPVKVQVAGRFASLGAKARQWIFSLSPGPLLKGGLAAAAVAIIGLAFFYHTRPARALFLDRINHAIANINNVHITRSVPGDPTPIQEVWMSRSLRFYLTRTSGKCVLWDVAGKVRKLSDIAAGASVTVPITAEQAAAVENEVIGRSLWLTPLYGMNSPPPGARLYQVPVPASQTDPDGLECYEMVWDEATDNGVEMPCKMAIIVDSRTMCPRQLMWYSIPLFESEFQMQGVHTVSYPTDDEILAAVSEAGF